MSKLFLEIKRTDVKLKGNNILIKSRNLLYGSPVR